MRVRGVILANLFVGFHAVLACAGEEPDVRAPLPAPEAPSPQPPPATPQSEPASGQSAIARPALPFPHPMIVEVLYAVPTGPAGDASADGTRHASGDEFVEIVNPHDKPIQLLGYSITDAGQNEKARMRFTFPACELPPRAVAVVFNGNQCTWTGPVGDAKAPAAKANEKFHGALVFTMRNTSTTVAFGNQGDLVTLSAPNGQPVHRLRWGTMAEGVPPAPQAALEEILPMTSRSSVERTGIDAGSVWRPHTDADKRHFSPGQTGALPAPSAK